MDDKRFYVYEWYFKDTNEVFYVGKGTGNRYKETKASRNEYFKNILAKHSNNIDVRFYDNNLTESEAWDIEKKLIAYYWSIGQCKANFHEGGCGGYTGNYNNPERSQKISKALTGRIGKRGSNNPLYGTHLSKETKEKISKALKGKHFTKEHRTHLAEANRNRLKSKEEIDRIANLNKGKPMPVETKEKMMKSLCPYEYQVWLNDNMIFSCLGRTELLKFCKEKYEISRTIVDKILAGQWKPTFKKHQYLMTLKILKIERCID